MARIQAMILAAGQGARLVLLTGEIPKPIARWWGKLMIQHILGLLAQVGFQKGPDPSEARSNLANTGIYVVEPEALRYRLGNTFFDLAGDRFPRLLGHRTNTYE
jgi:mannose-1-phosphate guanylyltransferase